MKKLILLFLLIPLMGVAQDQGTRFEHGLSWQQAKEKAKREKKYLLVDCFTTWCGPCKYMTNTVFPQKKVGDFFNKNFVNIKAQIDKTKGDNEEVKSWYADAEFIKKEFDVTAYPTFLIFSPQGELVHRIVGSSNADNFIAKVQNAFKPETQYYALLKKYESGDSSPETLRKLISGSEQSSDEKKTLKFIEAYLETQKDLFTKDNVELLIKSIRGSKSKSFQLMVKNLEKAEAVVGRGKITDILRKIILQENFPFEILGSTTDIDSLIAATQAKYPTVNLIQATDEIKVGFHKIRNDWGKFRSEATAYVKKYGAEVRPETLSSFAKSLYEGCTDPDCIALALAWGKRSVDESQGKNLPLLNVYVGLLYNGGKKEEAIAMNQKAMNMASPESKAYYQSRLETMKKGIKSL